jgi:hypothetical protein
MNSIENSYIPSIHDMTRMNSNNGNNNNINNNKLEQENIYNNNITTTSLKNIRKHSLNYDKDINSLGNSNDLKKYCTDNFQTRRTPLRNISSSDSWDEDNDIPTFTSWGSDRKRRFSPYSNSPQIVDHTPTCWSVQKKVTQLSYNT